MVLRCKEGVKVSAQGLRVEGSGGGPSPVIQPVKLGVVNLCDGCVRLGHLMRFVLCNENWGRW